MNALTSYRAALRSASLASTSRAFSSTQRTSLARMQIIGRLAAPPEIRPTSTGNEMIKYTVASDYGARDSRMTSWFNVAAFVDAGPRRDYLLNLPKGTMIHLDADAQMAQFEDSETGKKRSALNLIHRSIEVLSRPRADPNTEGTNAVERPESGLGAS